MAARFMLIFDFHDLGTGVEIIYRKGSLFKLRQKTGTLVTCSIEPVEQQVIIVYNIPTSSLAQLDEDEFQLLLAIPSPEINRFTVYMDKQWIREGLILSPGSPVYICNHKNISHGSEGVIRYKGNLPGPGKCGIWFGIELAPQHAGKGTSDGSFRHERFFTCSEDCAIFVSIFRIRKDEHYYRNRNNSSPDLRGDDELNSFDLDSFPFKLEERVVWISDEGPENGTIKWIGKLPESNDGAIVVGVYFDRAVGSGTGRYKGRQLFDTPRGHASLMPPLGLMKYSDFYVDVPETRSLSDQRDDAQRDGNFTSLETSPPSWHGHNEPDIIQSTIPLAPLPLRARSYQTPQYEPGSTFSNSDYGTDHQFFSRTTASGTTFMDRPLDSRYGISSPMQYSDYGSDIQSSQGIIPTLTFKFDIGSRVYALVGHKRYGIIRYIGDHPNNPTRKIAGIEMEVPDSSLYTDGEFAGERRFSSQPNKAFFIYLDKCHPDDRGSF